MKKIFFLIALTAFLITPTIKASANVGFKTCFALDNQTHETVNRLSTSLAQIPDITRVTPQGSLRVVASGTALLSAHSILNNGPDCTSCCCFAASLCALDPHRAYALLNDAISNSSSKPSTPHMEKNK